MYLRPIIRAVSPGVSPLRGGFGINISGENFANGCSVRFGFAYAQMQFINSNFIYAISPPQSVPGIIPVIVTNFDGQWDQYPYFTYVAPFPPGAVRVFAPTGGQIFQAGQQITVQWEAAGQVNNQSVFLLMTGRTPITLHTGLAGTARSFTFYAPAPGTLPVQAAVQVIAYNLVGDSAQASSQPFTIKPAPKLKEKDKEKEKDKDKDKELMETP